MRIGILLQAGKAKEQTKFESEKERIELAILSATLNSSNNKLTTEKLQQELQNEFKDDYGTLSGNDGWNYVGKEATYNISKNGIVIKQATNFKIYGNNTQQLPNDYQEVYWIGKSSQVNSWIDANIEVDLTSEVVFEMAFMHDLTNVGYEGPVNGEVSIIGHYSIPMRCNGIRFGNYFSYTHSNKIADVYQMATYQMNKNGCTVNKGQGDETLSYKATSVSGKVYPLGSLDRINSRGYIHIFKHYKNNSLISDLVACYRKSDGEIGMYDLVSNTFFLNQGTGTLIKGKNVGVGNLKATNNDNQYDLPLKITTISSEENINIIIKAPLRKENDVSDYLDLKNKKIVRYIDENNNILDIPIEENIETNNLPDVKDIMSISVETDIKPSRIETDK